MVDGDIVKIQSDPMMLIFEGNKLFKKNSVANVSCLDSVETFTRDFTKLYELFAVGDFVNGKYDMPTTCDFDTWDKMGSCAFEYVLPSFTDMALRVRIERCQNYKGFPRISIGCTGAGCRILTPCDSDASCPSGLSCLDMSQQFDVLSFLTSLGYYPNEAVGVGSFSPADFITKLIKVFGTYFPGKSNTAIGVCFPKASIDMFSKPEDRSFDYEDGLYDKLLRALGYGWLFLYERTSCAFTGSYLLRNGVMRPWNGLLANDKSPLRGLL